MWGVDTEKLAGSFAEGFEEVVAYLPTLLAAIAILVVGWIVAAVLGAMARGIARRTGLSRKVRCRFASDTPPGAEQRAPDVDRAIGKGDFDLAIWKRLPRRPAPC